MANNRMYLKCTKCDEPDNRLLIGKCYPISDCYFWTNGSITLRNPEEGENPEISTGLMRAGQQPADDRLKEFDEWFAKHGHAEDDYHFHVEIVPTNVHASL